MPRLVLTQKAGSRAVIRNEEGNLAEITVSGLERLSQNPNDKKVSLYVRSGDQERAFEMTLDDGLVQVNEGVSVGLARVKKERGGVSLFYTFPEGYSISTK